MFRSTDKNSGYLFCNTELRDIIASQKNMMKEEINQLDVNQLLNASQSDLIDYLVSKYSIEPPVLQREAWSASEQEVQIDVRHDRNRYISDRGRAVLIPGQRIVVEVPVSGDIELFHAQPSSFTSAPPRALLKGSALFLSFDIPHDSTETNVRHETERTLNDIEKYLSWIRNDLNGFKQTLSSEAERTIAARRERILANQGRVASLGIPLKVRSDAPRTYVAPNVRRKVVPTLPAVKSIAYEPEPTLDMDNYEHILSVMQNMAHVMERSPSAFQSMGEEDLRQHFLVQLNGQFEGMATGETFNVNGKTDILLRANGKNVFIGECKFWKGPKHYRETIDQLLGYTAWRDTKTAILVFNRGTAMSTVMAGIHAATISHSNYKKKVTWNHESGFRYVFHHAGDQNREFLLTVIVFDVP